MKLSLAIAGTLWAAAAHAQVLPSSGPGSTIPVSPDDTPLVSHAGDDRLGAIGLVAAMPGFYQPNPNNPTTVLLPAPDGGLSK
jgi:hypothetical protein